MRAVVCGANGAMGQLICAALGEAPVGQVSVDGENGACKHFSELPDVKPEVVIDFSHHSAVADVLRYALAQNCAAVIGTTGHTEEEKQLIHDAARKIPVFFSGNMSLGIAVLCRLAARTAAAFPEADIEILESEGGRPQRHCPYAFPGSEAGPAQRRGALRPFRGMQADKGGDRHFLSAHGQRCGCP